MLIAAILSIALAQAGGADRNPDVAPQVSSPQAAPDLPRQLSPDSNPPRIPAGTEVQVELTGSVSSATSHVGDKFALRLAEPIVMNGKRVVPAGAIGEGEVIDAARAGMAGRQGKLIVSARYLDLSGRRVRIRGMTFLASGKSHVDLATGVLLLPYVGVTAMLIEGGEIAIPAGTRATAKLAEDVEPPPNSPTPEAGKQ